MMTKSRPAHISKKAWATAQLQNDFLLFFKWAFKKTQQMEPLIGQHHIKIAEALNRVVKGKTTHLIINIPPQYGKSLMAVQFFIAWGFAINSRCKFLHASASDDLALRNSKIAKDIIQSDWYQFFWERIVDSTTSAKSLWEIKNGGGLRASSTKGQIMGFSAGRLGEDKFSGALIIDDPLKSADAFSEGKRNEVNLNFTQVLRNRIANDRTPIILIMQRLHPSDLTGHIIETLQEEYSWEVLKLPALLPDGTPLWEDKFDLKALNKIKKTTSSFYWQAQYMQDPVDISGGMIKPAWFVEIEEEPEEGQYIFSCDTAIKTGKENDYSVIAIFKVNGNHAHLKYLWRNRLEFPELLSKLKELANMYNPVKILIEDKASGQQLVQVLRKETLLPIVPVKVNQDKITRVAQVVTHLRDGAISLPKTPHIWKDDFLAEVARFPNAKHDDMVDSLTQFVQYYHNGGSKTIKDILIRW